MNNRPSIRSQLESALLNEKKVLMWSYDLCQVERIPDKIIVEKYLQYGDKNEWEMLKAVFDSDYIKEVWIQNLVYCGLHESRQRKIARWFFNIKKPAEYLKKERKEHIERSIQDY